LGQPGAKKEKRTTIVHHESYPGKEYPYRMKGIGDGVRVDELPVGKKVQMRTREGGLYTVEGRDDSLYISGYGYPHLNPWKCWSIGCRSHPMRDVEVGKKNFVGIGTYMEFRINDAINGGGQHVVITGPVVEITAV
jgi:hypothetical protein